MKKRKEEDKEEEEQVSLSKTTNFLVCLIMCLAVFGRFPPLGQGLLFAFMPIIVTFDVLHQQSMKKGDREKQKNEINQKI